MNNAQKENLKRQMAIQVEPALRERKEARQNGSKCASLYLAILRDEAHYH